MMLKYASLFIISYISVYILVPIVIKISKRFEIYDIPCERSVHERRIPLGGGIAFGLSTIIMETIISIFGILSIDRSIMMYIVIGSVLILLLGFWDDKKRLSARTKLVFQVIIALFMYCVGFRIPFFTNPIGMDFVLGYLSIPITVVWFLTIINAINLIDGIDGLASGLVLIVSFFLFILSCPMNPMVMAITCILVSANLAFLKYNFSPAKIFMGDTGSMFFRIYNSRLSNLYKRTV